MTSKREIDVRGVLIALVVACRCRSLYIRPIPKAPNSQEFDNIHTYCTIILILAR